MSLSTLSSPLEQEPNSHAFFIGCVAKYCLIVSNVLISIIIMFLRCKITNFLLYEHRNGTKFIHIYKKLTFGVRMEFFRHGLHGWTRSFFIHRLSQIDTDYFNI